MSSVAIQDTSQVSSAYVSGEGAADGELFKQADTFYDGVVGKPPKGGWTAAQLNIKDEIEALESSSVNSVSNQLRATELKLDFVKTCVPNLDTQNSKFFSNLADKLSVNLRTLSNELDSMFDSDNTAVTLTEVNSLIQQLQDEGFEVPCSSATSQELSNSSLLKFASPLVQLRESLTATPTVSMESMFTHAIKHNEEKAYSLTDGSKERTALLSKNEYLASAKEQLKNSEHLLGDADLLNYENLTFSDLLAVTPESLKVESSLFKRLAEVRTTELRKSHASVGNTEAHVTTALKSDPLLNYYQGRFDLAEKKAPALASLKFDTASGKILTVASVFDYAVNVAKSDQVFYYSLSQEAATNGDAESKSKFDTMASEASDRIGVLNKGAQTFISMLTSMVEKAMSEY